MLKTAQSKIDTYGDWWSEVLDDDDRRVFDSSVSSAKIDLLSSLLFEFLDRDESVLIFSQGTEVIKTVEHFLEEWGECKKGVDYFCLVGNTSRKIRKQICVAFSSDNKRGNMYKKARFVLFETTYLTIFSLK